jgi:hypothetical protein
MPKKQINRPLEFPPDVIFLRAQSFEETLGLKSNNEREKANGEIERDQPGL